MRTRNVPVAELEFAAVPKTVRFSREFAAHVLCHFGLDRMIEDAQLVTSELVTNAIQATERAAVEPDHGLQTTDAAMIRLRFTIYPHIVRIEVWDRSAAVPVRHEADPDEEGSRGLAIVEALADQWGCQNETGTGKVVWATLAVPSEVAPAPLARRSAATELRGPRAVAVTSDPELLERVHHALRNLLKPKTYRLGHMAARVRCEHPHALVCSRYSIASIILSVHR